MMTMWEEIDRSWSSSLLLNWDGWEDICRFHHLLVFHLLEFDIVDLLSSSAESNSVRDHQSTANGQSDAAFPLSWPGTSSKLFLPLIQLDHLILILVFNFSLNLSLSLSLSIYLSLFPCVCDDPSFPGSFPMLICISFACGANDSILAGRFRCFTNSVTAIRFFQRLPTNDITPVNGAVCKWDANQSPSRPRHDRSTEIDSFPFPPSLICLRNFTNNLKKKLLAPLYANEMQITRLMINNSILVHTSFAYEVTIIR